MALCKILLSNFRALGLSHVARLSLNIISFPLINEYTFVEVCYLILFRSRSTVSSFPFISLCFLFSFTSFGGSSESFPHPELEWDAFVDTVKRENEKIPKVWNPRTKVDEHWVRSSQLGSAYGMSKCVIS